MRVIEQSDVLVRERIGANESKITKINLMEPPLNWTDSHNHGHMLLHTLGHFQLPVMHCPTRPASTVQIDRSCTSPTPIGMQRRTSNLSLS